MENLVKEKTPLDDFINMLLVGIDFGPHTTVCYQCDLLTQDVAILYILEIDAIDPPPTLIELVKGQEQYAYWKQAYNTVQWK